MPTNSGLIEDTSLVSDQKKEKGKNIGLMEEA